mgnify:CR=1 FL=1
MKWGYDGFLSIEFESFNYYRTILRSDPVEAAKLSMKLLKIIVSSYKRGEAKRRG